LDLVAALLIAVLAGMGVGGGGLLVLYLVLVKGMEQLEAQGNNLIFFIFASTSSLVYLTGKRKINWKTVLLLGVLGAVGVFGGSRLARVLAPDTVRKIFGWLLMISGFLVLVKKKEK